MQKRRGPAQERKEGIFSYPPRKVYLELPPPTLEDNVTDIARISRELRRKLGWHSFDMSLACLQHLSDTVRDSDWKVTATLAKDKGRFRIQKIEPLDTSTRNYGLAVDVGTTTVVAQLVDLRLGKVLGVEGSHNLQAQYGEDVISRMVYACGKGGLHRRRAPVPGQGGGAGNCRGG